MRSTLSGLSAIILAISVTGCATSPRLVDFSTQDENGTSKSANTKCSGNKDEEFSVCIVDEKSTELIKEYYKWYNDPAIFDYPLIAFGTTLAGLFLFDGGDTAIKAMGLATGTTTATRLYVDPQTTRSTLLNGASAYGCLADIARIAIKEKDEIQLAVNSEIKDEEINQTVATLIDINNDDNLKSDKTESSKTNLDNAVNLLNSYKQSIKYLDYNIKSNARKIGINIINSLQKQPFDINSIYNETYNAATNAATNKARLEAIKPTTTTGSNVNINKINENFSKIEQNSTKPADKEKTKTEIQGDIISKSNYIINIIITLPHITETVGKFNECTAATLPRSP